MALAFTFTASPPTGDAYEPRNTDAPDALQYAPCELPRPGRPSTAPCGGTATATCVTNVVLVDPQTGQHLAQWNIWQPGAPLP